MPTAKSAVRDFWDAASCGEVLLVGADDIARFKEQARARYELEPYIEEFARFREGAGKDVLEIGVGLGADHCEWAKSKPRRLCGVDLTPRAIALTKARFAALQFDSELTVGDAENLPFPDNTFDIVYSYGVLHHTPDTARAITEAYRVLRPGGVTRIMVYHSPSFVGLMLWARYGLMRGYPLMPLNRIYADYLESPGTKAYSLSAARRLFAAFSKVKLRSQVSHGDLLNGPVGQRHAGALLKLIKRVWPRALVARYGDSLGTALLIEAVK